MIYLASLFHSEQSYKKKRERDFNAGTSTTILNKQKKEKKVDIETKNKTKIVEVKVEALWKSEGLVNNIKAMVCVRDHWLSGSP